MLFLVSITNLSNIKKTKNRKTVIESENNIENFDRIVERSGQNEVKSGPTNGKMNKIAIKPNTTNEKYDKTMKNSNENLKISAIEVEKSYQESKNFDKGDSNFEETKIVQKKSKKKAPPPKRRPKAPAVKPKKTPLESTNLSEKESDDGKIGNTEKIAKKSAKIVDGKTFTKTDKPLARTKSPPKPSRTRKSWKEVADLSREKTSDSLKKVCLIL